MATLPSPSTERDALPESMTWDLRPIYVGWAAWEQACAEASRHIDAFGARRGSLAAGGADALQSALEARDALGELVNRVYAYASLRHDEDQRDSEVRGRLQRVQAMLARAAQASAWFEPELLTLPEATVMGWCETSPALARYRFLLETLFRLHTHVLDAQGETLLSLAGRLSAAPADVYESLSVADFRPPTITLSDGQTTTLSHGQYRALLATNRSQPDRAAAFHAFHRAFVEHRHTYAALYHSVLQRDWFHAQARGYGSSLEAALDGNAVPVSVVETLIRETRASVEPLQLYHRLRQRALGLEEYFSYDSAIPLVEGETRYPYADVLRWLPESVSPLGSVYQETVARLLRQRTIDVCECAGKRNGAYSAPVYGCPPYILLNYNETLDAVFTLAHELGHSMHTMLAHGAQPFVYADYTIFVAEVPSTLSEALLLRLLLARATSDRERVLLLQHAIDGIAGTFYTQVMFADFEWQAHRLVEAGEPITADVLDAMYADVLTAYHGDAVRYAPEARHVWARIPHFFNSPYYVYQYATCFASSAALLRRLQPSADRWDDAAVDAYLTLLRAGGSNQPMVLLRQAGIDLSQPDTVRAVPQQLAALVDELEATLARLT